MHRSEEDLSKPINLDICTLCQLHSTDSCACVKNKYSEVFQITEIKKHEVPLCLINSSCFRIINVAAVQETKIYHND